MFTIHVYMQWTSAYNANSNVPGSFVHILQRNASITSLKGVMRSSDYLFLLLA